MKFFLCLIVLCIQLIVTWTESPYFSCDPETDCQNPSDLGTKVPDPSDCEKYYICVRLTNGDIAPSATSESCPPGNYFDQESKSCLAESVSGICENLCGIGSCRSMCPSNYQNVTLVADINDCSSFYICRYSSIDHVQCPVEAPYFNGGACVVDESLCCNFCEVSCYAPYVEIMDPCDCNSYYICDSNQIPSFRTTCFNGTYFDEYTGSCIHGTCTSICTTCDVQTSQSTILGSSTSQLTTIEATTTEGTPTEFVSTESTSTESTATVYTSTEFTSTYFPTTEPPTTESITTTETTTKQNCFPNCPSEGVEIQDPCDCSSFYVCIATGTPSEDYKLQCETGSYFNETIQQCLIGACTPQCSTC